MNGNRITGLETDVNVYPVSGGDGASKAYVDYKKQQIEALLPTLADNGVY